MNRYHFTIIFSIHRPTQSRYSRNARITRERRFSTYGGTYAQARAQAVSYGQRTCFEGENVQVVQTY